MWNKNPSDKMNSKRECLGGDVTSKSRAKPESRAWDFDEVTAFTPKLLCCYTSVRCAQCAVVGRDEGLIAQWVLGQ